MNPKWVQRLLFFIDPKLRSFDKDLFKYVTQDIEEKGIFWTDDLSLVQRDLILPCTFILSSDTSLEPEIQSNDKTLVFGDSNMSIFGRRDFPGDNHVINSSQDWKRFNASIAGIYHKDFQEAAKHVFEESLSLFKMMVKRGNAFDFTEDTEKYSRFEEQVFGLLNLEQVKDALPKLSKELGAATFFLKEGPSCYGRGLKTLPLKGKLDLYLCWKGEASESMALRIYSVIEDVLSREESEEEGAGSFEDMQIILSELPMPLALFDRNSELVLHNPKFINLNLSAKSALNFEDDEQFSHGGELYRAKRIPLTESGFLLFTFIPVKEFLGESASPSSEELGIISSSIAHELNNPLGGVSGALDVLMLDEHPSETLQSLKDMKAGVLRCKKLVETFLGFSKIEANKQKAQSAYSIQACLDSAMELIRFRLIENNMSVEVHFEAIEGFAPEFNPHVMSMTFYLILGDLLTGFGHQKLIAGDRSACLQLKFIEERRSLSFASYNSSNSSNSSNLSSESLELGEEFLKSKLLGHLLDIQHLKVVSGKAESGESRTILAHG